MNINLELLKLTSLFKDLTVLEINKIFSEIHVAEKTYHKGSIILIQEDKYNELYILIKGTCYAEMLDYSGKNVKIEDIEAPYIIASAVLFAKDNFLPVSLTAKTDCTVLILKKEQILRICSINKMFLNNLLNDISNKFNFISKRLSILAFKTIKEKVASYLLTIKKDKNGKINLPINLEELSDYLAVARPSLSRLLMQLEENKIIKKTGRTIEIIDEEKLIS